MSLAANWAIASRPSLLSVAIVPCLCDVSKECRIVEARVNNEIVVVSQRQRDQSTNNVDVVGEMQTKSFIASCWATAALVTRGRNAEGRCQLLTRQVLTVAGTARVKANNLVR